MKIRKGFVSNSSSSSFVCDVCGQDVSGWDMSLHDAEMYQCENGHTFCEDHAINFEFNREFAIALVEKSINKTKKAIENYGAKDYYVDSLKENEETLKKLTLCEEDLDYDEIIEQHEYRYELPAQYCPICQMEHITTSDMVKYLLKENGKTKEQIELEMKEKFVDIDEFKHYLDN
ncbi:MAG: hypothetical protein HPY57_15115 [Ignavibacteria bacterium]|nr:hypothetical protein [Ignavibacteria bacterium]